MTATMREWIVELLNSNREKMAEDFKRLSSKDRLQIAERLLHYVLPKQQAISGTIENIAPTPQEPKLDLLKVSDEDMGVLIDIIGKYGVKKEPDC